MRNHLDWREVLTQHRVPFIEKGANVSRGELNIRCPFCGSADPSYHMGLNPDTGYWSCWRNKEHRGKSPVRLLMRLLNVDYARARDLCGLDAEYVDPDEFSSAVAKFMGRVVPPEPAQTTAVLEIPGEFRPLTEQSMSGLYSRFGNYLYHQRGFDLTSDDPERLCEGYDLRGALTGPYKQRLILPYFQDRHLVAWTGRAIAHAEVRYKDIPVDQAAVQVRHTFFNHDAALDPECRMLIVCEGPLDALKLDFYMREHGVRAVALSTNSMSRVQADKLRELAPRLRRVLLLMDQADPMEGMVASMRMRREISDIPNISIVTLHISTVKDAGEMSPAQVLGFLNVLIRKGL